MFSEDIIREKNLVFISSELVVNNEGYNEYRLIFKKERDSILLLIKYALAAILGGLFGFASLLIKGEEAEVKYEVLAGSFFTVIGGFIYSSSAIVDNSNITLIEWIHFITLFHLLLVMAFHLKFIPIKKRFLQFFIVIGLYSIINLATIMIFYNM